MGGHDLLDTGRIRFYLTSIYKKKIEAIFRSYAYPNIKRPSYTLVRYTNVFKFDFSITSTSFILVDCE